MYTYIYIHIYIYIYIYIYICMYTHIHREREIYICIMCINMCMYVYIYTYTHTYILKRCVQRRSRKDISPPPLLPRFWIVTLVWVEVVVVVVVEVVVVVVEVEVVVVVVVVTGGTTCLTLLVSHTLPSKVANDVANSLSRIKQVMPQPTALEERKFHPHPYFRTISEAPVPEYGGAPNLCEDLY